MNKQNNDPNNDPQKLALIGSNVTQTLDNNQRAQKIDNDFIQFYIWQNFLNRNECEKLVQLIDNDAQPSTLYKETEQKDFRTSSSCNMDPWDSFIMDLDKRISGALGLNPKHSETLQGQRYEKGQQFKEHHDYFHTSQAYWKQEGPNGGQRSWTTMIFLNQAEEGGTTEFPYARLGVKPLTGTMLIWNNMYPDGTPNPYTLHTGKPVIKGTKYIVTKWFRQNAWG